MSPSPTLAIGPLRVDPPVVLAPMAGVTNRAFRRLCRSYGAGLYVSEMVLARALVERNRRTALMVARDPDEPIHSVQLSCVDPQVGAAAVRILVEEVGVDHVDLNFGCPAAKVTRRGGGAALPLHGGLFRAIVGAAVAAAGPVPVTVKLRLGVDGDHLTYLEAGRVAEGEGAAAVALHARTAEQLYSGRARWDAVARLKEAVTVPVLGNGDIWVAADAVAMVAATGCDGVVVGRGCLGRPWLFRDLADAFAGRPPSPPPGLAEVCRVLRHHAGLLEEVLGPGAGVRDLRKHVGWYLTGFPVGGARRGALAQVASLDELDDLLGELLASQGGDLPFPPGGWAPRGHTQGPRPVHLPERWLATAEDLTPPEELAGTAVSGG